MNSNLSLVVGIDEVGRGCWAGPLVAGAVILAKPIPGLKDSKLLPKAERERLDIVIREKAVAFGLGWVDSATLDNVGITTAVKTAMQEALLVIEAEYQGIIIDGNYNYLQEIPGTRALIKADLTIPAVSAASILAKVARDNHMAEMAKIYPGYGFEKHVGYGTKLHMEALRQQGVCGLHRLSFAPIKAMV